MKFLVTILLIAFAHLLADAQSEVPPVPPPVQVAWSSLLPNVEYCHITEQSLLDNKQGQVTHRVNYERSVGALYAWVPGPLSEQLYCVELRIEFTYPFTPQPEPPEPPLTKKQQHEKKKAEQRLKKNAQKLRKVYESSAYMYPAAPPPRYFTFKGYPAGEYFKGPCDYIPCEVRTSVSVQFAKDRVLHITSNRFIDHVERILNSIDFGALDSEITKWVQSREPANKTKGPPVAEKP